MRDYKAKTDQGKTDWSLLPWRSTEKVAEVMTQAILSKSEGGSGYDLASWRTVPGGFYRYWSALMRHIIRRFVYNEIIDPESGKPHLASAICCLMFVCEIDLEGQEDHEGVANGEFYERDI